MKPWYLSLNTIPFHCEVTKTFWWDKERMGVIFIKITIYPLHPLLIFCLGHYYSFWYLSFQYCRTVNNIMQPKLCPQFCHWIWTWIWVCPGCFVRSIAREGIYFSHLTPQFPFEGSVKSSSYSHSLNQPNMEWSS